MIGNSLKCSRIAPHIFLLLTATLFVACATPGLAPMANLSSLAPSETVYIDGITLNYTSSTIAPEDVTLVLIHGFGASLETWYDVYPSLSAQFRVVRLDLKGHGFSSKPEDDNYTLDEQARLVIAFITKLGLKRVVLIGHSFGGGVAVLTYLRYQDQKPSFDIVGMVLIDSAGYPQALPFFVKALRDPVRRFFIYLMSSEFRTRLLLERVFSVTSQVTPERVHRYAYFFDLPGSRNALEQTAKHIVPPDVDQLILRFRQISIPTLIIWGERDSVIPVENAHKFAQDIKTSRLAVFPETGHVPHEERPAQVLKELGDFLRALQ